MRYHPTPRYWLLLSISLWTMAQHTFAYERSGWRAQLSTLTHGVSGTVTIMDRDTLRIENFHYDGGGPAVYFYLGQSNDNAAFSQGLALPPLLSGTTYRGDELQVDLPAGRTLDGYTAISVWCVDFAVNFGSGTFGAEVQYEVTFNATWSRETHTHFPPNPHFSGLIGGTHNPEKSFWQLHGIASPGIEVMAETGGKSPLRQEVESAIRGGSAYSLISGGGIGRSPGSVSTTFTINTSHPRVSLVSMIAPSPDWFVGVADLALFRNGRWLGEVKVDLLPYDAGTDSGSDFTSPNDDTQPAEPIHVITDFPFGNDPPLGTFTFRLVCDDPPVGDLNNDCRVDHLDLAILSQNWMVDFNLRPPDTPTKP